MKKRSFNIKNGVPSQILSESLIKRPLKKTDDEKRGLRDTFTGGIGRTTDLTNITIGYSIFEKILFNGLDIMTSNIVTGGNDVSRFKMGLNSSRKVIENFIARIEQYLYEENEFRLGLIKLKEHYQYAQAARDGLLLKKETRLEKDPYSGHVKEVMFDVSMTPNEVMRILTQYENNIRRLKSTEISNYIGLGTSFIGIIGMMARERENRDVSKKNIPIIPLGGLFSAGLNLVERFIPDKKRDESRELSILEDKLRRDFIGNEQISDLEEEKKVEEVEEVSRARKKATNQSINKNFAADIGISAIVALVTGIYISSTVQLKENKKFDGKKLAEALIGISEAKGFIKYATLSIQRILSDNEERRKIIELSKKVDEIEKQMREKVYLLEGAKHKFNGFSIHNFDGQFYPTKNYETEEITYSLKISVPEFSMKRGDVILISGESGTGKSTFLRFLKRGDYNNRSKIQLDSGEYVDSFGSEYISFRPSINLGDETTVLHQITGKSSIYELSDEEREFLLKIMKELKFLNEDVLEELASKKFMQFSTGQQRRLALSKVFYNINNDTSVIIVDEPVGNVEDSLIREQLELIREYAQKENLMLILVTHRIDLASDLVNKRYNINSDGIMEEIPIISKSIEK